MRAGLDAAWVTRLDAALRSAEVAVSAEAVVVGYEIEDDFRYWVTLHPRGLCASLERPVVAGAHQVTFRLAGGVGPAIVNGTVAAQAAILDGRLAVQGDATAVTALTRWRSVLATIDAAAATAWAAVSAPEPLSADLPGA